MLDISGYTPIFRIDKDNVNITANFEDRLISIVIESVDGNGKGDKLTMVLDDRDWIIESPNSGGDATQLQIYMGYAEVGLWDMGTFKVDEVTYEGMPKQMEITASSQGFSNAAKSPVILSHEDTTLGDVAKKIAEAAGASLQISSGLAGRALPYLNQYESSLHLIQKLERDNNALVKFQDNQMSFTERGTGRSASGEVMSGFVLGPEDLANWSIRENNRTAHSKVRASYIDPNTYEQKWVTSEIEGKGKFPFMIKRPFSSEDQAKNGANAKMSAGNRGTSSGTITLVKGNPAIKGGQTPFSVANCREGMDGDYIISVATHTLTKGEGLQTKFEFTSGESGSVTGTQAAAETPEIKSEGSDQIQVNRDRNINSGAIGHPQ